jgi:hypothetical protein
MITSLTVYSPNAMLRVAHNSKGGRAGGALDPGGLISVAIGEYNQGNPAEAQAMALIAIATALNQFADVVENL